MVKTEERTIWKCPYCASEYDDLDEAEDCASECVDVEEPEEETKVKHFCEICDEDFEEYVLAAECEDKHKKGDDIEYQEYLDELEKHKLEIASQHKEQTRLKKWVGQ